MALRAWLLEPGPDAQHTREIPVNPDEFLIGRGADCNLRLRMTSVSRHHCYIRVAADEVTLVDLGSSNGTYLNNERVRSQAVLHSGDEVRVGDCRFVVDLRDQAADKLGVADVDPFAATLKLPKTPEG